MRLTTKCFFGLLLQHFDYKSKNRAHDIIKREMSVKYDIQIHEIYLFHVTSNKNNFISQTFKDVRVQPCIALLINDHNGLNIVPPVTPGEDHAMEISTGER